MEDKTNAKIQKIMYKKACKGE
jgi:hypothetical protein